MLHEIYILSSYFIRFHALWKEIFGLDVIPSESGLGFVYAWLEVGDDLLVVSDWLELCFVQ